MIALLSLSLSIFHQPESITQIVHILYTHSFIDLGSAFHRDEVWGYKLHRSNYFVDTHMSSVESFVMPTLSAFSFPSAMIACV